MAYLLFAELPRPDQPMGSQRGEGESKVAKSTMERPDNANSHYACNQTVDEPWISQGALLTEFAVIKGEIC